MVLPGEFGGDPIAEVPGRGHDLERAQLLAADKRPAEAKPGRGGADLTKRTLDEADLDRMRGEHGRSVGDEIIRVSRRRTGKGRRPPERIADLAGHKKETAGPGHLDPAGGLEPRIEQSHPPARPDDLADDRQWGQGHGTDE